MYLNPEGSVTDNEGPHCRNCHTGASSCNQCHGLETGGVANANWGTQLLTANKSVFAGDAFAHTAPVTTVANECLDGGFSFPHRTLGKDLLKDELYGVDFDGSAVAVGDTRSTTLSDGTTVLDTANYPLAWARSETSEVATTNPTTVGGDPSVMVWESGEQITSPGGVENLDSVCIDCHGDATVWNGDDPATFKNAKGWELLWKGLP